MAVVSRAGAQRSSLNQPASLSILDSWALVGIAALKSKTNVNPFTYCMAV